MLLYSNNFTLKGVYGERNDVLECYEEDKYSIISHLNEDFKIKGKYIFMIDYPEEQITTIWQQTKSPVDETDKKDGSFVDGFKHLYGNYDAKFTGLAIGSNGCYFDGTSKDGSWHYCIGCFSNHYNNKMPGPSGKFTRYVSLWVKFPVKILMSCMQMRKTSFLHSAFVLVLLIRS